MRGEISRVKYALIRISDQRSVGWEGQSSRERAWITSQEPRRLARFRSCAIRVQYDLLWVGWLAVHRIGDWGAVRGQS
jgi:hypothetical protein